MVGQKNLQSKINNYTLDTFPRASLIVGEQGSGKHLIADMIKTKLGIEWIDIMNDSNTDIKDVKDYIQDVIPTTITLKLFIFDLTNIGNKRVDIWQSALLKVLEDAPKNVFILIIAHSKNILLNTIINRCHIFEMERYSKEELKEFTQDELLLSVLRTPGQIKSTNPEVVIRCVETCKDLAKNLKSKQFLTLLDIVDKINYKDNYDKMDIHLFFQVFMNELFTIYRNAYDNNYLKYYLFVNQEYTKLNRFVLLDKERFMEHFFVQLRKLVMEK